MPFSNPWTETDPTDATYVREVDDWIRRLATAVRERMAVEHYLYATESGQQNIGKHKPGSAKIYAAIAAAKPSPDPSAPGTIAYETDAKRLVYDTGSAWAVLAHNNMHKAGGDDPITPADIGALAKAGDVMTGPLRFSATLPQGIVLNDVPAQWPDDGITFYAVAGPGLMQWQPAPYGVLWHIALAGVRYQIFFGWTHPGAQQPPGSFWWRHAGDGDANWSAWARLWSDLNDGHNSGMDADTTDGAHADANATANTLAKRDSNGDLTARVLKATTYIQIPVLSTDPPNPPNGAMWAVA